MVSPALTKSNLAGPAVAVAARSSSSEASIAAASSEMPETASGSVQRPIPTRPEHEIAEARSA